LKNSRRKYRGSPVSAVFGSAGILCLTKYFLLLMYYVHFL
jgi:hypothetical protein